MGRESSVRLPCVRGDPDIQVVHVEGGAPTIGRFADHVAQQVQRVGQRAREGVFERLRYWLTFPGFGEVDSEEAVQNDGVKLALNGVRQSVATFDLGEETSGE